MYFFPFISSQIWIYWYCNAKLYQIRHSIIKVARFILGSFISFFAAYLTDTLGENIHNAMFYSILCAENHSS